MPKSGRILVVTGASGHPGRRIVELLLEKNEDQIVAVTPDPEKLSDLADKGLSIRKADFNDSGSLDSAFRGAERLFLLSTDLIDKPGKTLPNTALLLKRQRVRASNISFTPLAHIQSQALPLRSHPITLRLNRCCQNRILPGLFSETTCIRTLFWSIFRWC